MTESIVFIAIAIVAIVLFFVFQIGASKSGQKTNIIRIISYVLLLLFLLTAFFIPEKKILTFAILIGAIIFFGINQYKSMKKMGGNIVLWLSPVILALLAVILFIIIKATK